MTFYGRVRESRLWERTRRQLKLRMTVLRDDLRVGV